MSDFRIKFLGLAAFATLFAGASYGQVSGCGTGTGAASATPGPATMRSEGTTELTGDLTWGCTTTGSSTTATVTIFASAPVTSKLLTSAPVGGGNTEAALFVGGTVVGGPYYGSVSGNQVSFTNVTLGTGAHTFKVQNVRVNASAVTLSATLTSVTEQALVSENNTSSAFAVATTVGYVFPSLQATTLRTNPIAAVSPTVTNYTTCSGNAFSATKSINASFVVTVKGLFAGAFKLQASTAASAGEGGSFIPGDGTGAGAATSATKIQLAFAGVPSGLTLYLPTTVSNAGLSLQAVDANGAALPAATATGYPRGLGLGSFAASFPSSPATESTGDTAAFTSSSGTVTVTYLVTGTDKTNSSETADIPVYVAFAANAFTTVQGPITVLEGYAPQAAAGAGSTIPSFAVQTGTPVSATTIALCQTNLLFPFITSAPGFDTGIALANTSADPFGSAAAPGSCTLNFYGTGAPTPSTGVAAPGGIQAGGATSAFLLSGVAPGFTGYMIAVCNYQFGHGFAYIAYNLSQTSGTSMGYIANVLPNRSTGVISENLNQ